MYSHLIDKDEVDAGWRTSIPTNVSLNGDSGVKVARTSNENDVGATQTSNDADSSDSDDDVEAAQNTNGDLYVDFSTYPNVGTSTGNVQASGNATSEGEIQSNLGTNLQVPTVPVTLTNMNHPIDNVIGDPRGGIMTRSRSLNDMQC